MSTDAALAERPLAAPDVDAMAEQARAASDFMKALAHEGRLMILCHLVAGEKSVSELEDLNRRPAGSGFAATRPSPARGTGDEPP